MSDSFVVKLALIKIMIKPAKSHYTPKDGSAALILLKKCKYLHVKIASLATVKSRVTTGPIH